MRYENPKITTFKDLVAWQKSHAFVIQIYKNTNSFPDTEQFGLTTQLRRAAVSVASNITEGFGRRSAKDRSHFYDMARASLHEVQAQLLIAKDVDFLSNELYTVLEEKSQEAHRLLTGLINKTKSSGQKVS